MVPLGRAFLVLQIRQFTLWLLSILTFKVKPSCRALVHVACSLKDTCQNFVEIILQMTHNSWNLRIFRPVKFKCYAVMTVRCSFATIQYVSVKWHCISETTSATPPHLTTNKALECLNKAKWSSRKSSIFLKEVFQFVVKRCPTNAKIRNHSILKHHFKNALSRWLICFRCHSVFLPCHGLNASLVLIETSEYHSDGVCMSPEKSCAR